MPPRKKPTVEQRLSAITETVELVAGMQLATEQKLDKVAAELERLATLSRVILTSHEARIQKLEKKRK